MPTQDRGIIVEEQPAETRPIAQIGGRDTAIIEKVNNGFIVKVGCATFVSQTWTEASEVLGLYWKDPQKAMEKYYQ